MGDEKQTSFLTTDTSSNFLYHLAALGIPWIVAVKPQTPAMTTEQILTFCQDHRLLQEGHRRRAGRVGSGDKRVCLHWVNRCGSLTI